MPSFFISTATNTAHALQADQTGFVPDRLCPRPALSQTGFVTEAGTIWAEAATAVPINGSASLTVMGTVAIATGTAAIRAPLSTIGSIAITVGAQGPVLSTTTDAMRLIAVTGVKSVHAGLVSGQTGVYVQALPKRAPAPRYRTVARSFPWTCSALPRTAPWSLAIWWGPRIRPCARGLTPQYRRVGRVRSFGGGQ